MQKKVHFISIGGAVMHNMAIALHKKGYIVTGSDDEIYEPAKSRLQKYGLLPHAIGWNACSITSDLDAVILGMHARANNPELDAAKAMGLKIYSFPEFMFEQTQHKKRIVVGGSHGKTTTTAMILHVLKKNGIEFDYLVGSQLEGFETMVGFSESSKLAVFEGDEYLTSALDLRPKFHVYQAEIGIITGIEWDHINVFPTYDNYKEQFEIFAKALPENGALIYCAADKAVDEMVNTLTIQARKVPYSTPQFEVANGKVSVQFEGKNYPLQIFGTHNLQNMMAAMYACQEAEISNDQFLTAIGSFTGTAKRLETIKATENSIVYRDFAHAPSKLRATVNAVRELYPERKLIAVYELHTYSSLDKAFLPQYANSMQAADFAAVLFSKHALEMKKMPMLSEDEVAENFGNNTHAFSNKEALHNWIKNHYSGNENLLLMSSGTFDGMSLAF